MLNLCLCKLNWGTELEILQNNEVLIARYSVTLFMVKIKNSLDKIKPQCMKDLIKLNIWRLTHPKTTF